MPLAARADSENLCGADGCKMSVRVVGLASQAEDEDPSATLGHAEVLSVELAPRHAIPEFDHRTEERPKVSAPMTGEETRDVLKKDGSRSVNANEVQEGEGEAGSVSGKAGPLPGDAEVLAGEASGPEGGSLPVTMMGCIADGLPCRLFFGPTRSVGASTISPPRSPPPLWFWLVGRVGDRSPVMTLALCESDDVPEVGDCGPVVGEDGAGVGVDLGEGDGSPSGSLKPKVNSSHP